MGARSARSIKFKIEFHEFHGAGLDRRPVTALTGPRARVYTAVHDCAKQG